MKIIKLIILSITVGILLNGCESSQNLASGPPTKEMYKCSYKNLLTNSYYYGENPDYNVAARIAQRKCLQGALPHKCLMHYCEKIF